MPTNQIKMTEHTKFTYSPLEKALEKQTRKQIDTFKSFNRSNKYFNLKKMRVYFKQTS